MCGRYFLDPGESEEIDDIIKNIQSKNMDVKTGEIFPSNNVPLIVGRKNHKVDVEGMIWGFHGFKKSQLLINARAETVTEKKTFASAFSNTRCVFPTTGFFEWNKDKQKFLFNDSHSTSLYLAGFYKNFEDGNRSTILTTAANQSVDQIHERMPLILKKEMIDQWIFDEQFAESYLKEQMPMLISTPV
ncbi:SOS response-associated peptidase [Candidatus Enterococcus ikei]|uniref:Abasic site processing protein n=1 Tax=Candidatus Enterococcus ikei TaxID=2815326 RepID=A0ABS3H1X8_9ENTE|nr:SOS response-associated peptidase family protein [Enterococcus sp. DIV0869a]MBO0441513.1 SOS response-associated peptidase family protein [Enterococcus sp. DIV0869a]